MPIYEYISQDNDGREQRGKMLAESQQDLAKKLDSKGLFLISWHIIESIKENLKPKTEQKIKIEKKPDNKTAVYYRKPLKKSIFSFVIKKSKLKNLSVITRQLSVSLESATPLIDSIRVIIQQIDDIEMQTVFEKIRDKILAGNSFSSAISEFPQIFSPMYINMIIAGESGGFLPAAMKKMAEYTENQITIKNNLRNNLIYPSFVFFVSIATLIFMATFIIPTFLSIFTSFEGKIPFITKMLIAVVSIMREFWYIELIIMAGAVYMGFFISKKTGTNIFLDSKLLAVPLFGTLIKKLAISRFLSTLGTLLQSGVSILEAIEVSKGVTANSAINKEIDLIYNSVREGRPLYEKIYASKYFPILAANMILTGEQAGRLPETLAVVSKYYEEEIQSSIKDIFSVLEPILIISLGFFIGLIAVSMLLPILSLPAIAG